jgi:hypothetical protein
LGVIETGDCPGAALWLAAEPAGVSVLGVGVLGLQPAVSRSAAVSARQAESGLEMVFAVVFTVVKVVMESSSLSE